MSCLPLFCQTKLRDVRNHEMAATMERERMEGQELLRSMVSSSKVDWPAVIAKATDLHAREQQWLKKQSPTERRIFLRKQRKALKKRKLFDKIGSFSINLLTYRADGTTSGIPHPSSDGLMCKATLSEPAFLTTSQSFSSTTVRDGELSASTTSSPLQTLHPMQLPTPAQQQQLRQHFQQQQQEEQQHNLRPKSVTFSTTQSEDQTDEYPIEEYQVDLFSLRKDDFMEVVQEDMEHLEQGDDTTASSR